MSGSTSTEGYPYPLEADFADVQDSFRLATSIDADLRSEQAPFRNFIARPSFIGRQVANGGLGANLSVTAIDWDNTGGLTVGSTVWRQPYNQQPSWWMFGCTLLIANTAGTPVAGELNLGQIAISTTDQVSGVVSTTSLSQRNDETNTNGEWINIFGALPVYRGVAVAGLTYNGSSTRVIGAGSRLWGFYLGPVI